MIKYALTILVLFCAVNSMADPGPVGRALQRIEPRLSDGDAELIRRHPIMSVRAGRLARIAQKLVLEVCTKRSGNDQSDALEHFMWAALMHNRLGRDWAEKILAAHEDGSGNSPEASAMDAQNNATALRIMDHFYNGNVKAQPEHILEVGLWALRSAHLVFLRYTHNCHY